MTSRRLAIPAAIVAALTLGCYAGPQVPVISGPSAHYEVQIVARDKDGKPVRVPIHVEGSGVFNGTPGLKLDDQTVLPFSKDAVTVADPTAQPYTVNVLVPQGAGPYQFMVSAVVLMTRPLLLETGITSMDATTFKDGQRLSIVDAGAGSIPYSVMPVQTAGTFAVLVLIIEGY